MNIRFDKVYCISYCRNIEKQNNIRKVMNYLGIDFEFIYGADYSNLKILKHKDFYFDTGGGYRLDFNEDFKYYTHFIGASYDHYTAIIHAYESGANSVLIFEDDCLFNNDVEYIKYHLNNYPKDADFVKFGYYSLDDNKKLTYIDSYNKYYSPSREYKTDFLGCQMYGICNRETMQNYIILQSNYFTCSDIMHLRLYDMKRDFKCYSLFYPLAIDGHKIKEENVDVDKFKLLEHIN